jgi:hypothetical protein
MTEIEKFLTRFPDYETKPEQVAFAKYLEQQGLRFMIDFGFENAERVAWELIEIDGVVQ